MKKLLINFYLFIFLLPNYINCEIIIKRPKLSEVNQILDLDQRVTFEFFKPLFKKAYSQLSIGKDVNKQLSSELEDDAKLIPQCIKAKSQERILIAVDSEKKLIVGLILFHREQDFLELDILLIDKDYRGIGIGKKLVLSMLNLFNDIKSCHVYPIKIANENTLKFYESLGFVNQGTRSYSNHVFGINYFYKLDLK